MGIAIAFQRERWKMLLLLQAIVCFLLHSVVSDCPPHLNNTTMLIGWTDGQQTTLEDALLSLQTPSSSGRCTRLLLSAGVHYLTQWIHTMQSVVLQRHPESHNDLMPVIRCADGMRRTEYVHYDGEQLSATVSFSHVDYVKISDIIFEHCPLPLQFKAVNRLEIAHSIFRGRYVHG